MSSCHANETFPIWKFFFINIIKKIKSDNFYVYINHQTIMILILTSQNSMYKLTSTFETDMFDHHKLISYFEIG